MVRRYNILNGISDSSKLNDIKSENIMHDKKTKNKQ